MSKNPTIQLAVRDFALPVPRVGSIEAHSGYGRATTEGQLIHVQVQMGRQSSFPWYRPEVPVRQELSKEGYHFQISGRMDGIFEPEPPEVPRIEEIKTSFNIDELSHKLSQKDSNGPLTHPYCLQLRTYGYFYWLQNKVVPELGFHLVSTRNGKSCDTTIELNLPEYEKWLDLRLLELVEEAAKWEKRGVRRRKTAEDFPFPFANPRPGQVELIQTVEEGMKTRSRMLIQAPTGLGKTVGVLYPALIEALSRGQNVIYVTPKNSQHSVAEDAIGRFQLTGSKVRSLTITAKSKICFKPEPLCNPDFCEYARDHYTKVGEADLLNRLARKKKLTYRTFRKLGEEYQVCPFELQLDAAREAETVICDYNYVFSPRSAFGRLGGNSIGQQGKPNLVIDEAHNLHSRGMDYYSPSLSTLQLERMRPAVNELPEPFRHDANELLGAGIQAVLQCRPEGENPNARITPPVRPFLDHESRLRSFLSRYLESDVEIFPKDVVLRLCSYWSEFTAALEFVLDPERTEFFTTFQSHPNGGTVKITCCDASAMLNKSYEEFDQVVGFSATLKPFDYYTKLSGLDPETTRTAEFPSPFPKNRRKLLIIPQISTKFSERSRNYPKIAETISRIAAIRPGNYFAFFPSFDFLDRVLQIFMPPEGFTVIRQEREMKTAAVETIIGHLRQADKPSFVFAVQGGVFSEGVDYPGETIIGAFVVGPPLPSFDLEREEMRDYYQKHYGAGFDYAYSFPAMAKAVQAAGRVIRSETDRGLIVLMDNRFLKPSYTRSMPAGWYESSATELVSKSILGEVSRFWSEEG